MENTDNSSNKEGQKRLIGTLDPDYISPPDAKKIKLLKAKGEEEFYSRVVKVVEKQFMTEIERKNCEIEEIDEKILKVQQCLHTLRYCISLNFYAFGKFKGKGQNDPEKNPPQVDHPVIRHHLGIPVTSVESLPTSESLSTNYQKVKRKNSVEDSSSDTLQSIHSEKANNKKEIIKSNNECTLSTQPPCEVISQGRQGRFQKKIRVVIGNTYQYIKDSEGVEDHLKFRWRIYVRGSAENDISDIVSSVKFTLDKSYSPHDIIIIREPPFSLSRRGWGEFKIYLELTFTDTRNKPIQMMHHLTLARSDDPLAFTGIWRLGKEMWYDIWLYTKSTKPEPSETTEIQGEPKTTVKDIEMTVNDMQEKGMRSEKLYSDSEGNVTLAHNFDKEEMAIINDKTMPSVLKSPKLLSDHSLQDSLLQIKFNGDALASKPETVYKETKHPLLNGEPEKNVRPTKCATSLSEDTSSTSLPNFSKEVNKKGEQKLHKILIRQADGSLVSWMVPRSMYNMAVKFSEKNLNKSGVQSGAGKANVVSTTKSSHCAVVPQNGDTTKGIVVGPGANGNIVARTSLTSNPTDAKKNGLLKAINILNNIKQTPFPATKVSMPDSTPTLAGNPRGTLIRFSPLLQKQVLINPPNTNAQQQAGLPALIKVPGDSVSSAAAIRVSSPNQGVTSTKTMGVMGITSTSTSLAGASNPIRLSVSTLSPNNAKVIKTALMGVNDKKTTTLSVNLKKATSSVPLTIKAGQPPLSIVESGGGSPARVQQSKVTLLNNGIRVNTSQILRSSTASPSTTNGVSISSLKTSTSLSLREVGSSATSAATTASQPCIPPGKITTRRIFISAPPHLVKLREAASQHTLQPLQQEEIAKSKVKSGTKRLVEEIENEVSSLEKYEERKKMLRKMCSSCTCVDEILRIYMKGLPLYLTNENRDLDLPFSSPSLEHFKCCLVGRRRATEFWRAREIKKELQLLDPPNWQAWSVVKIASWARRHRYTPVSSSLIAALDKRCRHRRRVEQSSLSTLTALEIPTKCPFLAKEENSFHKSPHNADESQLIVVDSSENEEDVSSKDQIKGRNQERELNRNDATIQVAMPDSAEESHFLDLSLSKVRLKLEPEEIIPGVKMDVAKSVLWKATTCFMEDLLRSTYAEAVTADTTDHPPNSLLGEGTKTEIGKEEEVDSEPKLKAKHLLAALFNGRPQFQLFSQYGFGRPDPPNFDNSA